MKILHILSSVTLLVASVTAAHADNILSIRDTITDPYIVYPESYEADVHKLMTNWYMQNYVTLDRSADSSADVKVTDEVLIERLQRMPVVIEMPFNSVVKSYIEMYTQRRRSLSESMLGMSTYYMQLFEEALDAEGIPLELKYLPIIESALNPNAVSRVGATGLWQFMLPTARGLGMEINALVDQRRDPITSSRMAARYLHQLYDIYNDWSLAIAAYNCGPGNINKALRKAGEGKKDFWEIYHLLPRETRGYVPAFIAVNYAMTYYPEHNISPALARQPLLTDTVSVNKRVHFKQISSVLDIPVDALRTLNPQYREDVVPGHIRPYTLILPSHQSLAYTISADSIAAYNAELYNPRGVVEPATGTTSISEDGEYIITEKVNYYKIKRGDTPSKLARKFGVSINDIKKANGGKNTLYLGKTIKIVTKERKRRPKEEVKKVPINDSNITLPTDSLTNDSINIVPDSIAMPIDSIAMPTDSIVMSADSVAVAANSVVEPTDSVAVDANAEVEEPEAPAEAETEAVDATEEPAEETEEAEEAKEEAEEAAADAIEKSATVAEPEPTPKKEEPKAVVEKKTDEPVYHRVRKGENLYKIAKNYGTTVDKIKTLNPDIDPNRITVRQRIRVK